MAKQPQPPPRPRRAKPSPPPVLRNVDALRERIAELEAKIEERKKFYKSTFRDINDQRTLLIDELDDLRKEIFWRCATGRWNNGT